MLAGFDPLVSEWFAARFGHATEPQVLGWPEIAQRHDVLISAPTGSGKTLAAFLTAIDSLVRRARLGPLPEQTEIVYVSPLKALSNDVHKNLETPLREIAALAQERGIALWPIRASLRTGDTPQADRQRMTRVRPHILVTTPESLFILLTAAKPREMLASVRTVIVDEIHAVADDKRGAHLALDAGAPRPSGGTERPPARASASVFRPPSSRWKKWRHSLATARTSSTLAIAARWTSRWKCPVTSSARLPALRCGAESMTALPN